MARHTYSIAVWPDDEFGPLMCSADSGDYWQERGDTVLGDLVRTDHPFVTKTGRVVIGSRLVKSDAKVSDLWRLGI